MNSKDSQIEELQFTADELIAPGEVIIGQLYGFSAIGEPLVNFPQNPDQPLPAQSTISVNHQHTGRQVALMFMDGNLNKPLIIGFLHSPLQELIESFELSAAQTEEESQSKNVTGEETRKFPDDITIDGKRIVFEGQEEIVLKCGEASITLTKAGKILIRGKYLLNRSSGVNRILGGSVQVN